MYYSDRITLRKITTTYTGGFPSESVVETIVWADRHSIKRAEFFAAQAAGIQADIAFTVRIEDFDDHTEVTHGTKTYDIVRTYELDSENIDLTCRRR